MKPLKPESRRLIDEVSAGDLPSADLEERLWQTLAPRLGEALPPTAAAASRAMGSKSGLLAASSPIIKLVIGAVVVGASATATIQYWNAQARPRAASHAQANQSAAAQPEAGAGIAAEPDVVVESKLSAETQLLARAERELRTGDPTSALTLIDEHAERFPNGVLAQERDAARVLVLCALKRPGEARRVQQQFLRAWPQSPLAARVERGCAKPAP